MLKTLKQAHIFLAEMDSVFTRYCCGICGNRNIEFYDGFRLQHAEHTVGDVPCAFTWVISSYLIVPDKKLLATSLSWTIGAGGSVLLPFTRQ